MFRRLPFLTLILFFASPLFAQEMSSDSAAKPAANALAQRLGYPANSRLLIIHADDFGVLHSVDTATEEALENHWVTSASILVPCPWFPEVAEWAKAHPDADLGIHTDLNAEWANFRWGPLSPQPKGSSLLDPSGYLPLTTAEVVAHAKPSDVDTEVRAQIDKAAAAGIHISHIDTHMGSIVSSQDLLSVYLNASRSYKLPALLVRDPRFPHGTSGSNLLNSIDPNAIVLDAVLGIAPGVPKSQWLDAYEKVLQPLPPGTYQLIVHLAHNDAETQGAMTEHANWGAEWRQNDLDLVRSPAFQKFLKDQGFVLVSWKDLAKAVGSK